MLAGAISLSACEEEKKDNNSNDPSGGGNISVPNNTVAAGSESASVNKYLLTKQPDLNAQGEEYISIFFYQDVLTNRDNTMLISLKEIPAASTTLTWQSGSYAVGNLGLDEFVVSNKVNGKNWYGEYTATGYATTGNMEVTVANGKITFAFEGINLGDNFIGASITERRACGGKVTLTLSELQNFNPQGTEGDLID